MLKFRKRKAFTLVEILITIAIIGILAAIILVMVSGKDKARQKSAYAAARSAQARLLQCVTNDQWTMVCNNGGLIDCRGNINANTVIKAGDSICGTHDGLGNITAPMSSEKWPDLSSYNYVYSDGTNYNAACSSASRAAFDFAIYKNSSPTNIFCCTQNGCEEMNIMTYPLNAPDSNCAGAGITQLKNTLCKCKEKAGLQDLFATSCS